MVGPSEAILKGLMTDPSGAYHDISRGAFDVFAKKHPDEAVRLEKQDIHKSIGELASRFGIDLGKYDDVDYKGVAAKIAKFMAPKLGALASGAGITKVLTGATEAFTPAGWALLGVETAIEFAATAFNTAQSEQPHFKRGDWVVIDKGQKTVKSVDRDIDWAEAAQFGDAPDISELHVLTRVEDYHVGFYVSSGQTEGTIAVFDILTGNLEQVVVNDVRLLPRDKRFGMDNDKFASEVRSLYFLKSDDVYMQSDVSTDPGTEVIFEEETWHVVSSSGRSILIEASDGFRMAVDLGSLTRGRQARVGPAYRYKNGKPVENMSFHATPGGFGAADWVWVDVGNHLWELAVIHVVNGPDVVVYMATTGKMRAVAEDLVKKASNDDADVFNRVRDFALFRRAAVESFDTERLALPAKYRPLVLTDSPEEVDEVIHEVARSVGFRINKPEDWVATHEVAEAMDQFAEVQQLYGVPVSGEFAGEIEGRTQGEFMGAQPSRTRTDSFGIEVTETRVTLNTGYIAAGCVAAFVIYRYAM